MFRTLRSVPAPLRWRAVSRFNTTESLNLSRHFTQPLTGTKSTVRPIQSLVRHFHQPSRWQDGETGEQRAVEFSQLQGTIHDTLISTLTKRMGYKAMTDVQSLTIHEALKGQDVLGQAKTGTGKTVAFLLPILQRILLDDPSLAEPQRGFYRNRSGATDIRAVIISPTRELAEQIAVEAKKLVANTGIAVQTGVGGTQKSMHLRKMQSEGCHLLVGTPGRLKDLLSDPSAGVEAPKLTALVLDEADRLMDDGFYPEIQEISRLLPSPKDVERQTMLFSATMDREVLGLARQLMRRDFHHVQTVNENEEPTHERVPQNIVTVPSLENMLPTVAELCEREIAASHDTSRPFKAIVYFNATAETDLAASIFLQMKLALKPQNWRDTRVYRIHSRLSQTQRTAAADSFRRDQSAILFSSDVTARGMDFPDVTHVIQVGLPSSRDTYIHRIGRTGRAGKEGTGWLIIPKTALNEARMRIGDLPLKRNDELSLAKVDWTKCEPGEKPTGLTEDGESLLEKLKAGAANVERFAFGDAYRASLGTHQWVKDKQWLIGAMNRTASVVWGMSKPPGLGRALAQKLNLLYVDGVNIAEESQRSFGGDRFGRFDDRRGGGSRDRMGGSRGGMGGFRGGAGGSRGGRGDFSRARF